MTETEAPLPTDFNALRRIGWPFAGAVTEPAWQALIAQHPNARPARVVEQHRSGYVVADAPEVAIKAESLPEWTRPRFPSHERAAVGDWVLLEGEVPSRSKIVALLPRRTSIKRGAAGEHYHQQVIGANIDTVFVVMGLDDDFNARRIERYLLLVGGGGAQPVVVLSKADKSPELDQALAELAKLDAPVFAVNAKDRDSVSVLAPWLGAGNSVVLVGSSGAGKSTLTNTLLGEERMKTGEVRSNDSRGRHTTTYRALLTLPSGACIIDTPGMRELKPTGEEDLAEGGFTDVEVLAAQCKFRNCAHQAEPGCAVRAALESGELEAARFANYLKLRDEVVAAASKLAARLADKQGGKVQSRSAKKRSADKSSRH